MNLILLEPDEIQADGLAVLTGKRARHVREVLQAAEGEQIRVGVVDGPIGPATVVEDGKEIRLKCALSDGIPPVPRVDLLLAMPRPKVMNRLWPVLASLGVGRILISNAWKTERNYFDTHVLEPEHIREALIEGLQQARDTRLPPVGVHKQFKKLVEDKLDGFGPHAARLVAHPGEGAFPSAKLASLPREARVLLAVGPEGGWTPFELELLAAHGFESVSWGPRALRTDTACVVLLGLVHAELLPRGCGKAKDDA
ncbi:MAG: 16S rRNA (uracil(1498)-N(3))-methyltransferase [Opitutae bacterium]|nr:16S rRNA (uracil(1498)-N(3))-methyltransferase [Opitutae bacterium]